MAKLNWPGSLGLFSAIGAGNQTVEHPASDFSTQVMLASQTTKSPSKQRTQDDAMARFAWCCSNWELAGWDIGSTTNIDEINADQHKLPGMFQCLGIAWVSKCRVTGAFTGGLAPCHFQKPEGLSFG